MMVRLELGHLVGAQLTSGNWLNERIPGPLRLTLGGRAYAGLALQNLASCRRKAQEHASGIPSGMPDLYLALLWLDKEEGH